MAYSLARDKAIVPKIATADLRQGQLVKLVAGKVVATVATDTNAFGVCLEAVAAGEEASIYVGVGEIVYMEAHDNAITAGETLKLAAGGRVDGGATGNCVGMALEDSTGQGHLIECVRLPNTTV